MRATTLLKLLLSLTLFAAAAQASAGSELKPWTGGPAPPISLTDLTGHPVKLADFKGKVVLVNFWATWCGPCIAELPAMQRLRDKLSLAGFEVLAINYQESEKKIEEFLKKRPLKLPILRDADGAVRTAWNVRIFPTSFIIDTNQNIRYTVVGDVDWTSPSVEDKIRDLLPKI